MKLRFSFTAKILLPYLVLVILFFMILRSVYQQEEPLLVSLSFAGMLGTVIFAVIHLFWLKRSLNRIRQVVTHLTRGRFPGFSASKARDEIGDLERSLEKHVSNLKEIADFSRALTGGDFSKTYDTLSSEDELGDALNSLKNSLMDFMKEAELRRQEEENSTWVAQGLAKFSSLFREAEDNLKELSSVLMRELVKYTEADAGALFIAHGDTEDPELYLEVSGSYAFDREKQVQASFKFGEGLVGRAAVEKELIYITDLPADYMKIRSGLGEDTPASILLVPVLLDQKVLGVMELASLGAIPEHQVEFIRQLAGALAATLAKVNANLQNMQLFEQTKKQAEALASQEKVFLEKMVQLDQALEKSAAREAALQNELAKIRRELS